MPLRHALYRTFERIGFHIVPARRKGFYSPMPNVRELAATLDRWAVPSEMPGLGVTVDEQLDWVRKVVLPYVAEITPHTAYVSAKALGANPDAYGPIEARVHYGVLRSLQPSRVVEIGCGVSTIVGHEALSRNGKGQVTAIEPYPRDALRTFSQENDILLIDRPAQEVALNACSSLRAGDVLFIDSSHAVKPGSDVPYLVTEVLPRLAPGVHVQVHDIFFPYSYQPNTLTSPYIWTETVLFWAYLIHNAHARMLASLSWLHHERADALREIFPDYRPRGLPRGLETGAVSPDTHFPSSLWFVTQ